MNSQSQSHNGFMIEEEESIDLKKYLFRLLDNWYWVVASVVMAMTIAFLYNRYSTNYYQVKASILIDQESSGMGSAILEEMEFFTPISNIENEQAILKSYSLMRAVVDSLELYIELHRVGNVKSSEIYGINRPFAVQLLSDPLELNGVDFTVKLQNGQGFLIQVPDSLPEADIQEISLKWSDTVTTSGLKFILNMNQVDDQSFKKEEAYRLVFRNPDQLTKELLKSLEVNTLSREATILEIAQEAANTDKSRAIIQTLIEKYIDRELTLKNETASKTITFINQQLEQIRGELFSSETDLEQFRSENLILDISQEGVSVYSRIQGLEKSIADMDLQLNYYKYLADDLRKQERAGSIVSPTLAGVQDQNLNALVLQLNDRYNQQLLLQSTVSDINPQVQLVEKQIRALIRSIQASIRGLQESTQLTRKELQLQLQQAERELNRLPADERQFLNIQRSYELNNDLFVYLQEKLAEASISKASAVATTQWIDPPMVFDKTQPKSLRNYAFGILFGLILPLVGILLKDYFTVTIQSADQVEKATSLPILSIIGLSKYDSELVMHDKPRSSIAEGFRVLRSGLRFLSERPVKTILVTSFTSGDGKTFNAINTAVMLAKTGKKTLLLGLDLRKPKIFDTFGFTNDLGASQVLIGDTEWKDVVHSTRIEQLDFIASGPIPPNPNELLVRETFERLMNDLKEHYEYIVIDSAPMGLVSDSFEITKVVDVTLFVIRHQVTHQQSLLFLEDACKKQLLSSVGIIYNGLEVSKRKYGYGYRYGYGYGQGYYYEN